jgi:ATP-dependent nuclease, subunit B
METIHLSPSGMATYENCPMSYYLDRVLRIRTRLTSASLGLGQALAQSSEAFLRGTVTGNYVDPVPVFEQAWDTFVREHAVRYPSKATEEQLKAAGAKLAELLPAAWEREGLSVALDAQGEPMIERKLVADIGQGVRLVTKLDLCAFTPDWELMLVDQKATAQETDVRFALMGDQLTAYQMTVTTHAPTLQLPAISKVAYWEMIRRNIPKKANAGKGPEILPISSVKPRSSEAITRYVNKVHGVATRIRNRDFPKTPRMAYNTPCTMCAFLDLCSQGRTEDYVFPSEEAKEAALKMAA